MIVPVAVVGTGILQLGLFLLKIQAKIKPEVPATRAKEKVLALKTKAKVRRALKGKLRSNPRATPKLHRRNGIQQIGAVAHKVGFNGMTVLAIPRGHRFTDRDIRSTASFRLVLHDRLLPKTRWKYPRSVIHDRMIRTANLLNLCLGAGFLVKRDNGRLLSVALLAKEFIVIRMEHMIVYSTDDGPFCD